MLTSMCEGQQSPECGPGGGAQQIPQGGLVHKPSQALYWKLTHVLEADFPRELSLGRESRRREKSTSVLVAWLLQGLSLEKQRGRQQGRSDGHSRPGIYLMKSWFFVVVWLSYAFHVEAECILLCCCSCCFEPTDKRNKYTFLLPF